MVKTDFFTKDGTLMNLDAFESERLFYRAFTKNDFDDLFSILGNPKTCEYLPIKDCYNENQVNRWLDMFASNFSITRKNVTYAITLKNNTKVIGYAGCSYIKEFNCNEIEYVFNESYFGKGYASEAARKMKEVAIQLDLKKLVALADINNIPSQKILEKIGYTYIENKYLWGITLKYYELTL